MDLLESVRVSLSCIISNKLRSFLTMLGIIIGISSVIAIFSIGRGGKSAITGEFEKIGVNVLQVMVNSTSQINKRDYFALSDIKSIKERVPEVKNAAPMFQRRGLIKTDNFTKLAIIMATNEDYSAIGNIKILHGRFLNERDVMSQKNVVVLDHISAKTIFGYEDCTGDTVKLANENNTVNATVVGVYRSESGSLGEAFADSMPIFLYIPVSLANRLYPNDFNIGQIDVLIGDPKTRDTASSSIIRILENTHHNSDKYKADSLIKQLDEVNRILSIFTAVIGSIAGISLLVGGIGVMNIMLVSVTERTREIGIRKAIGATRRDIMIQFLVEAVIISLIGGLIGMLFGVAMAKGVGAVLKITPEVSLATILLAVLFSSAVGVFFGIYPASKASKLDPIEALRYE